MTGLLSDRWSVRARTFGGRDGAVWSRQRWEYGKKDVSRGAAPTGRTPSRYSTSPASRRGQAGRRAPRAAGSRTRATRRRRRQGRRAKPAGRGAKKDRRPAGVQAHGPSVRADRRKANGRTHERADDRAFTRRRIARRPAAEARREGASFVRAVRACRRVLEHDASALGARREARHGRQQRLRIGVEGGEGDRGIAVRSGESPAARSRGDACVARRHQSARRGDRLQFLRSAPIAARLTASLTLLISETTA